MITGAERMDSGNSKQGRFGSDHDGKGAEMTVKNVSQEPLGYRITHAPTVCCCPHGHR